MYFKQCDLLLLIALAIALPCNACTDFHPTTNVTVIYAGLQAHTPYAELSYINQGQIRATPQITCHDSSQNYGPFEGADNPCPDSHCMLQSFGGFYPAEQTNGTGSGIGGLARTEINSQLYNSKNSELQNAEAFYQGRAQIGPTKMLCVAKGQTAYIAFHQAFACITGKLQSCGAGHAPSKLAQKNNGAHVAVCSPLRRRFSLDDGSRPLQGQLTPVFGGSKVHDSAAPSQNPAVTTVGGSFGNTLKAIGAGSTLLPSTIATALLSLFIGISLIL